jgi:hypothetical protein
MTAQVSPVEIELCRAVSMDPPEDRAEPAFSQYRQDLVAAVDANLDDDQFDELSDDAQAWVNAAVEAILADKEVPDFFQQGSVQQASPPPQDEPSPEVEIEDHTQDQGEKAVSGDSLATEAAGMGEAKGDLKTPPQASASPSKEEEAKTPSNNNEVSKERFGDKAKQGTERHPPVPNKKRSKGKTGGTRIKELLIEEGLDASREKIHDALLSEGYRMSPASIDMTRYEAVSFFRVLREKGLIRPDANVNGENNV